MDQIRIFHGGWWKRARENKRRGGRRLGEERKRPRNTEGENQGLVLKAERLKGKGEEREPERETDRRKNRETRKQKTVMDSEKVRDKESERKKEKEMYGSEETKREHWTLIGN